MLLACRKLVEAEKKYNGVMDSMREAAAEYREILSQYDLEFEEKGQQMSDKLQKVLLFSCTWKAEGIFTHDGAILLLYNLLPTLSHSCQCHLHGTERATQCKGTDMMKRHTVMTWYQATCTTRLSSTDCGVRFCTPCLVQRV